MGPVLNTKLKRDEGRRRAALHFAEDFVMTLRDKGDGCYSTNSRMLQRLAKKNLGHEFNQSMVNGLIVFFKDGVMFKDNRYIFHLASFVCDMLDDSLDIKRPKG